MNLDLDTDEHKPLFKMMTTEETDQAKADVEAQVMLLVKKLKRNKLIKIPFILNAAEYKISVYDDDKIEASTEKTFFTTLYENVIDEGENVETDGFEGNL